MFYAVDTLSLPPEESAQLKSAIDALVPDVDTDGDQELDGLSFALKFATIQGYYIGISE